MMMKLATLALATCSALAAITIASPTPSGFTTITTGSPNPTTVASTLPTDTDIDDTTTDVPSPLTSASLNGTLDATYWSPLQDASYCIEDRYAISVGWEVQIQNFGHTKKCGAGYFDQFKKECGLITDKWCLVLPDGPRRGMAKMMFRTTIFCGQDNIERAIRRASNHKVQPLCYQIDEHNHVHD